MTTRLNSHKFDEAAKRTAKRTTTMNFVDINDDLSRELAYMSPAEQAGRIRGEKQWRDIIHHMERENRLPIENPGSQPDWIQLMRDGIPDTGDQTRHYAYTHYLGVVLDTSEVDALTFEDLALLAQGKVSRAMIMMAMKQRRQRKKFIQVLLSTLEQNEIYVPTHTTIALLVDRIRQHREDFETEFGEQTDVNTYELYLMRYHPFIGFMRDSEPTSIEYGICHGCKDHMPVNAKCTRVR